MNETIKITDKNRLTLHLIYDQHYPEWWLFIHNNEEHISAYEWNGLSLQSNILYVVTYSVRSYKLLPSPYRTNCVDYSQRLGVKTRKNCIRKCMLRESLEKCGVVSDEIDVYSGEQNVVFAKSDEEKNCTERENLNDICWKQCWYNDCYKQYMEPRVIEAMSQNHHKASLMIPFEPRTTLIHKPCYQLIEFLCYLASTLSLWFGFSVISVYYWIKDLIIVQKVVKL